MSWPMPMKRSRDFTRQAMISENVEKIAEPSITPNSTARIDWGFHCTSVRMTAAALPSVTAERVTVLQDMQLITVTPQIRAERGLVNEEGALIASISDRLSAQLGLQAGDVLIQVNRTRVTSADDARRIFESLRGQGAVRIYVERNGGYIVRDLYWRR